MAALWDGRKYILPAESTCTGVKGNGQRADDTTNPVQSKPDPPMVNRKSRRAGQSNLRRSLRRLNTMTKIARGVR